MPISPRASASTQSSAASLTSQPLPPNGKSLLMKDTEWVQMGGGGKGPVVPTVQPVVSTTAPASTIRAPAPYLLTGTSLLGTNGVRGPPISRWTPPNTLFRPVNASAPNGLVHPSALSISAPPVRYSQNTEASLPSPSDSPASRSEGKQETSSDIDWRELAELVANRMPGSYGNRLVGAPAEDISYDAPLQPDLRSPTAWWNREVNNAREELACTSEGAPRLSIFPTSAPPGTEGVHFSGRSELRSGLQRSGGGGVSQPTNSFVLSTPVLSSTPSSPTSNPTSPSNSIVSTVDLPNQNSSLLPTVIQPEAVGQATASASSVEQPLENQGQRSLEEIIAQLPVQSSLASLWRSLGIIPPFGITWEEVERAHIALVDKADPHQQCDDGYFCESMESFFTACHRHYLPSAITMTVDTKDISDFHRQANANRVQQLQMLDDAFWHRYTTLVLSMNNRTFKDSHGFGSNLIYDKKQTFQGLVPAFNTDILQAIKDKKFDEPCVVASFDLSSKNDGFARNGAQQTLRATKDTFFAFNASEHATDAKGVPIVRPSPSNPVPGLALFSPDKAIPVDCLEQSILMHTGFAQLCRRISSNAKHGAVHLETDNAFDAAYQLYSQGRTPITTMKEPVRQFIAGRYERHQDMKAEHEGKRSGLATSSNNILPVAIQHNHFNSSRKIDVLENHVSDQSCIRCGGYILRSDLPDLSLSSPATHPDISHCLFHLSIVDAHLKDKLTERQRLQLLNERTDMQGRHFCLVCDTNVDKAWEEGRGHGIVNAQSRTYISLCQKKDLLAKFYSNSESTDERTFSDSHALFFNPIDSDSSEKPCKYIKSSSSNHRNVPSSDKPSIDISQSSFTYTRPPANPQVSSSQSSSNLDELKQSVRTSRDNIYRTNSETNISDERGIHAQTAHETHESPRWGNESRVHKSDGRFVFQHPCHPTDNTTCISTSSSHGKGQSRNRDISDNRNINRNNSFSTSVVDHSNCLIQHSENQYSSLPDDWPTSNERDLTRIPKEQTGPFGVQSGSSWSLPLGRAVREPSISMSDNQSYQRSHTLPPAPGMGRFVAPIRQESYSHGSDCRGYANDNEAPDDRSGHRLGQSVQWLEEHNHVPSQQQISLPSNPPSRDRRPPSSSTHQAIYSPAKEDIDDGQIPYYMTHHDSDQQTKSRPTQSLALTPFVKSEVDSDSDVVILRKSKKTLKKKPIKLYSPDTDGDSSDSDSQITDKTDDKTSIFSLFSAMTCEAEHTEALLTLKSMLKKSDFVEVKTGDRGQRRNVRFSDYFSEKYSGNARKLKRYLQRLLQYSALSTTDDETRADIVSDGPGLAEHCITKLEQAARVPLPGLASTYNTDSISQKKRLLDLLLTYVVLFYQEEQTLALQDLRLKGPMFTGLTDLYHKINTGSTLLHPKHMEDYLLRGILRAENGDGVSLLKSFQNTLRIQKQMELKFSKDDQVYRKLLFTCCNLHTTEDTQVQLTPTITQPVKGGGRRFEQTNYAKLDWDVYEDLIEEYTALAEASPAHNSEYQKKGWNDRRQPAGGQEKGRNDNRSQREELFTKRFCMAPCACCGAKNHPMLSPIKSPEGAPLDCDYVCPTAICSNWQEQRRQRNALRFQPCPKKFAAMCHNDTATANTAIGDYERIGSGQYRNPAERNAFKRDVLMNCKAPSGNSNYPKRHAAGGSQVEQCHSSSVWLVDENRNIEDSPTLLPGGDNTGGKEKKTTVLELETNGVSTTPASGVLGYSALHLLLATRIEPATEDEVEAMKKGDWDKMITRVEDGSVMTREGGRGCRVRFQMPYGVEYIVRYPEVCGRILADTGSTTSLINIDFARRRGLEVLNSGAEIVLRDVNNGLSKLVDHCILRLTLTTIKGEHINILILAHCVKDLSHDLLLGTRDLERYQISVMAHRGESQMQIDDTIEYLPMLDGLQISQLQRLTSGDKPMC